MAEESGKSREEVYKREEETHDDFHFDENRENNVNIFYERGAFDNIYNKSFSMLGDLNGRTVLEYGCGDGRNMREFCSNGAKYVGIDISNLRISYANQFITSNHLEGKASAIKMNAEKLEFEDDSFDLIYGVAIIHHLDIDIAMNEIKRVLKPEGFAIFLEPRGNNPVINWYRNRTPQLRTVDEHPLVKYDFDIMKKYFDLEEINYFMLSLSSFVFRKYIRIEPLYKFSRFVLDIADSVLFAVIPFFRKYAWYCIIKLTNKRK